MGGLGPINLPLHGVGQGGHQIGGLFEKFHPLVVGLQIVFAPQAVQPVEDVVFRLLQQEPEPVGTEFFQKFVRVLGPLHPQDLDLDAGLFQQIDGPAGSALSGLVAVVGDDHLLRIFGQQVGVFLRQAGAERRHGAVKAVLMQGDGVHIALGQDDAALLTLFCHV